jgi:hypothetical protein
MILSLAPGVLDAGLGSLAGFAASIYAARFFDIEQLGIFGLFFVAFRLLGFVPARLVLIPAQVAALDAPIDERTAVFRRSLPLALAVGVLALPLVWLVVPLAPDGNRSDFIAFGVTTSMMVLVSPLQDHTRVMLHMADRSGVAVLVSAGQLTVALAAIAALDLASVADRWIPFLALSLANLSSLGLAIALVAPTLKARLSWWPGSTAIVRSGRLLLPAQALLFAGSFGASVLVARLASTEALGAAEAARVVASPLLVAGVGLGMVLNPRIMDSARAERNYDLAGAMLLFTGGVILLTILLFVAFGWSHPLNVAESIIPLAYSVGGLVAFRIAAASATVIARVPGAGLLGTGDSRGLLWGALGAVVAQLCVAALLADSIGAHAVPAGEVAGAAILAVVTLPRLRGLPTALVGRLTVVSPAERR